MSKRATIAVVALAVRGAGIAALVLLNRARPSRTVKVGYLPIVAHLPLFVALEQGYFEREGVAVQPIKLGFKDFTTALVTGDVDVLAPNGFPAIFALEVQQGGRFKIFCPGCEISKKDGTVSAILVPKDSELSTLSQLKGKRIGAISPTQVLLVRLVVRSVGLQPDDVTIIQLDRSVASQALASKRIDALFALDPMATTLLTKGVARLVEGNLRAKYVFDPYWAGAAMTTADFVRSRPDAASRTMRAFDAAVEYIRANETKAKRLLLKHVPLDEEAAAEVDVYYFYKSTEKVDLAKMQELADLLSQYEIVKGKVDVKEMYLSTAPP